jgi:hypothetical protein
MEKLIESRINCNEELAKHPAAQVPRLNNLPVIGLFGILNGIFGIYDEVPGDKKSNLGPICAVFDKNGFFIEFQKNY